MTMYNWPNPPPQKQKKVAKHPSECYTALLIKKLYCVVNTYISIVPVSGRGFRSLWSLFLGYKSSLMLDVWLCPLGELHFRAQAWKKKKATSRCDPPFGPDERQSGGDNCSSQFISTLVSTLVMKSFNVWNLNGRCVTSQWQFFKAWRARFGPKSMQWCLARSEYH